MLEQLFGSKTRTRLLKLFLLNPSEAFFIRELTRKIDTQINSVRRELQNLLDCSIVEVVDAPNSSAREQSDSDDTEDTTPRTRAKKDSQPKKFFRLNKNFVLYNELRNLFLKSPLMFQNNLIKELRAVETIDYALLSGFFADREDVNVDLLIVGTVPKAKLSKLIAQFEKDLEREINFAIMPTDEFVYRKSLADMFLFKLLEGKKVVVVDRIAQRSTSAAL